MEAATFENICQSDNTSNTIELVQQRNHLLKSLLQEKWKHSKRGEVGVQRHLHAVLLLSKQISAELLGQFKSVKEVLQIATDTVTTLCEEYHANTSHGVNTALLNYLGKTSRFLNHVMITLENIEISLHEIYYQAQEDTSTQYASDRSVGLTNAEHYKHSENSEDQSREEKESFQMSFCDSRDNQSYCVKKQQSLSLEMRSSRQDSTSSNIHFLKGEGTGKEADAVTMGECLQMSEVCSAGQERAMSQPKIQTSDEIKDQYRIIKQMDCSTEMKDTERKLKFDSAGNQDENKDIDLQTTSGTGGVTDKQINKSHDKNEVTELVKAEDCRGWSQRELFADLDRETEPQIGCYVTAPFLIVQRLLCKIINERSPMVVRDDEELVSNVISIQCTDSRIRIPFPLKIAIPFTARYQGNYHDIMVKALDATPHSSYLSPLSLEGVYNGHKKNCADVKIYKLGIFSVISCLRKETFTVPWKGLALKLSVDSRITLNYFPGSFSTSVVVQSKVQPIDSTLLNVMKLREDSFHPIISTTPLVHIKHPSTQQFRKSITITLPCPPNSAKRRLGDKIDHPQAATAATRKNNGLCSRSMSAPVKKPGDVTNKSLKLFGFKSKDEEWVMMDNVTVKEMQNGLVAIELNEHVERFIVLRFSSSVDSSCLISFIQKLEEVIQLTMVNIIIYHKRDNSHHIVVLMVPSKDLQWELVKLREEGFQGPLEPSEEFPMREGEQLILKLCGNIKSLGDDQKTSQGYQLIFHSQRKARLELELTEVNEFGNRCSPHYKGMAVFYKTTKVELTKQQDSEPQPVGNLDPKPVCKLTLTLPKREKVLSRSTSVSKVPETPSENLLYWVASEISEEDAMLFVTSLRIRRSAIQLVRLTSPDDLTDQIYKLLNTWNKNLPMSVDKIQVLSKHLRKCGRQDLAEELQSKYSQENPIKLL
ncbi:death domain-containing protein 1 [Hypanus sabinus]|uniref:death domain-containing protein 1 n=1 Tax=Hypanus sabinus TaxID=79690 RepID=UPI0028C50385|nr:death domain-containing protein 1 [Hypanus sabinus]